MLTLVFDTETTGFPKWKSPPSDPGQPHLVQLALLMTAFDEVEHAWNSIVYCPIEIPEAVAKIHGITTDISRSQGKSLSAVVGVFDAFAHQADRVVCHNVKFDMKVMQAAYHRAKLSDAEFVNKPRVCTMETATPVLRIPSSRGLYKWPKLIEAYKVLVDEAGFSGAHSADADAMACWKVLRALESKGVELR